MNQQIQIFGESVNCTSLNEIAVIIKENAANPKIRRNAAAYGMVLCTSQSVGETEFFEDTRSILDHLARAKAEIDIASWHDLEITKITADILLVAQEFVDETTIPCTEWALPSEVVAVVLEEAKKRASV
jgi:hypothetical protein